MLAWRNSLASWFVKPLRLVVNVATVVGNWLSSLSSKPSQGNGLKASLRRGATLLHIDMGNGNMVTIAIGPYAYTAAGKVARRQQAGRTPPRKRRRKRQNRKRKNAS